MRSSRAFNCLAGSAVVFALAWAALPAMVAQGDLIVYEPVVTDGSGYTAGSALSGQPVASGSGLTLSYAGTTNNYIYPQDAGLTYPTVTGGTPPEVAGGAVYMSAPANTAVFAEASLASPYTASADNIYWLSVIYRTPSVQMSSVPYHTLGLSNTTGIPVAASRGFTIGGVGSGLTSPVTRLVLYAYDGTTARNAALATSTTVSTVYWLLLKIDASNPSAQTLSAWYNPTDVSSDAALGTAKATISANVIADVNNPWDTFEYLGFYARGGTGGAGAGGLLDEVRFGNTFADVVPEPATLLLLVLGLPLLRRRKR